MEFINAINQVDNPLLVFLPLILISISGYTVGRGLSAVYKVSPKFSRDIIYGNVVLNFLFIGCFIILGLLGEYVILFFDVYTILLMVLSVIGGYLMFRSKAYLFEKLKRMKMKDNVILFSAIALFTSLIIYYSFIIYYHSIFTEYDSIYLFLLISKSVLLGDGLHNDFYTGSDITMRYPPFIQATNAWLIHSFGYSAMRLFPIYFVFLGSIFVYLASKKIIGDSFFGLLASLSFLITPALIITSSRYSLQQDLCFIFLLAALSYFLSEIIGQRSRHKTLGLLMVMITLSLIALSREIGLVILMGILFLLPAIKFTKGNKVLRAALTFMSLFPFYMLAFYNLYRLGITNAVTIELLSVFLVNSAIFYILYYAKQQERFTTFLRSNYWYLFILIIPAMFIGSNFALNNGPYPVLTFSPELNKIFDSYRQIMGLTNPLELNLQEAIIKMIPRIDLLFSSVAVGSLFIYLKLRGLGRLVYGIKYNQQYQLLLILFLLLLISWSFLLGSAFEGASARHIAYFLPIISIIIALGFVKTDPYSKVLYLGFIVFSIFYFITYDMQVLTYDSTFGGFRIDPQSEIITFDDLRIAILIAIFLLVIETNGEKIRTLLKPVLTRYNFQRILPIILFSLVALNVFILVSTNIQPSSHAKIDQVPPGQWERNVFEVVNYLKTAEEGNILSFRAPAISFFTNRTNFDIYNPYAFASIIYPLLGVDNYTEIRKIFMENDIRYVVLPRKGNDVLFPIVKNVMNTSNLLQVIDTDHKSFERISLGSFNIYKFNSNLSGINLIDNKYEWVPKFYATIERNNGSMNVNADTTDPDKEFNRAVLNIKPNLSNTGPLLLSLEYRSESTSRHVKFGIEILDKEGSPILSAALKNTNGTLINEAYIVPSDKLANKEVEIRVYIISEGPGRQNISLQKARLTYT